MIPVIEVDVARLAHGDGPGYASALADHAERRPWVVLWANSELPATVASATLRDSPGLWKRDVAPPPGDYLWKLADQKIGSLDFRDRRDVQIFRGAFDGWLLDSALKLRPYRRGDYRLSLQACPQSADSPLDRVFATASWLASSPGGTDFAKTDLVLFDKFLVGGLTNERAKHHERLANLSGLLGCVVGSMVDRPAFSHLRGRKLTVTLYSLDEGAISKLPELVEKALQVERHGHQTKIFGDVVTRCTEQEHDIRLVLQTMRSDVVFHSRLLLVPASGHVIELPWGFDGFWNYKSRAPGCDRPRLLLDTLKRMANPASHPDVHALAERIKRAPGEELDLLEVAQSALARTPA